MPRTIARRSYPSPARFKKGSAISCVHRMLFLFFLFLFLLSPRCCIIAPLCCDPACHVASIKDLYNGTLESRYWNRKRDVKSRRGRHEEARVTQWLEMFVALFVNILIFARFRILWLMKCFSFSWIGKGNDLLDE